MRKVFGVLRSSSLWMALAAIVRWFADPLNGPRRRAKARAWLAQASAHTARGIDQQRHPASARRLTELSGWAAPPESRTGRGNDAQSRSLAS